MDPKELLDKLLKLPTPVRLALLVGIYVLIVTVYYVGFYTEAEKDLEKKNAAFDKLHAQLVQTQNIASQIDVFIEEVEQLKEQLAQAQDQLPPDPRVDLLIEQITRIGKDNGLQFAKIVPQKSATKDFYAEIPLQLNMHGKFHAFGLFFNELAGQTRIINVSNLTLKRKGDSNTLDAAFTITTYMAVERASAKPAADSESKGKKQKR